MNNGGLSKKQEQKICKLIVRWHGKFTWGLLVKAIENDLGISITRQSLCEYFSIKKEYDLKKLALKGLTQTNRAPVTASEADLTLQMERLKAEVEQLERVRDEQLKFIQNIFRNAREIPNIDINKLAKPRT